MTESSGELAIVNAQLAFTILYNIRKTYWDRIASYKSNKTEFNLGAIYMKRNFVFTAILSLFVLAISVSAQNATNFAGTWTLDVSKSKLGDRNNIESQTLTVVQTDKDIKVTPVTKRLPPPGGAPVGGGGGRMGGGGGMGGGDTVNTYTLDGKETTIEIESPMGKMPVKLTGKWDAGKLVLSSSRTFSGQNGEITSTTKDTWSLSADGNTLTVDAESTSPRGTTSTQKVFAKKP